MTYDPNAYQENKEQLIKNQLKYHRTRKGKASLKRARKKYHKTDKYMEWKVRRKCTRDQNTRFQRYTKNELYQLSKEYPMNEIEMYIHYHATFCTYQAVADQLKLQLHEVSPVLKKLKRRMREIMKENDDLLLLPHSDSTEMIVIHDGTYEEKDGEITFSAPDHQKEKLLLLQERAADYIAHEKENFFLTVYLRK